MDWRYNTIWFKQIDPEKKLTRDFKGDKSPLIIENIEYFICRHFKQNGTAFAGIPSSDKLLYLNLTFANIKDFSDIVKFPSLKRLEVHYCTKIESDSGLLELVDSIEFLHISKSKKLPPINEISKLKNLKVLCLNQCGVLENLDFLRELPDLIDFRFVDTNVISGDLTPILEHPNLRNAGFLNKRHYNNSWEEIDLIFKSKSKKEYKDYVYQDQFETYKYKVFG